MQKVKDAKQQNEHAYFQTKRRRHEFLKNDVNLEVAKNVL